MQIMTAKEASDFLRMKESTVRSLASEGKLPGVRIGKAWRFDKAALERIVTRKSDMIDGTCGQTKNLSMWIVGVS